MPSVAVSRYSLAPKERAVAPLPVWTEQRRCTKSSYDKVSPQLLARRTSRRCGEKLIGQYYVNRSFSLDTLQLEVPQKSIHVLTREPLPHASASN